MAFKRSLDGRSVEFAAVVFLDLVCEALQGIFPFPFLSCADAPQGEGSEVIQIAIDFPDPSALARRPLHHAVAFLQARKQGIYFSFHLLNSLKRSYGRTSALVVQHALTRCGPTTDHQEYTSNAKAERDRSVTPLGPGAPGPAAVKPVRARGCGYTAREELR